VKGVEIFLTPDQEEQLELPIERARNARVEQVSLAPDQCPECRRFEMGAPVPVLLKLSGRFYAVAVCPVCSRRRSHAIPTCVLMQSEISSEVFEKLAAAQRQGMD
jgi:hypothetical protein